MTDLLARQGERGSGYTGPWTIVALLSVAFVINYMDRQVVFAIFPLLRSEMGFSDTQLGLAGSLFTWTYSAAMPLAGRLADLYSKRNLVIASLLLWSCATVITGLSRNIHEFLLSRVLMGLSESLYVPAAMALITLAHSSSTRSRALAVHGMAQFTGITLGSWYGGWTGEHYGWRSGIVSLAVAGIVYSLVLAKALRPPASTPVKQEKAAAAPTDLVRSVCFWTIGAAFFSFCAMLWMLYAWLPNFIYETYKLSLAESGLTATLFLQSSSAAGVLIGGYLGDSFAQRGPFGRFRVLAIGLFCCAPFAFATYGVESLFLLKLSACGYGLFAGLFVSNIFASLYDVVSRRNYGLATGIINMIGGLGAGAAILFTGMLKQSFAISTLMSWGSILAMVMAVVLTLVIQMRFLRECPQTEPALTPTAVR